MHNIALLIISWSIALANSPQAKKRIRQNQKARLSNIMLKSRMRTAIKKVLAACHEGKKETAAEAYRIAQKLIDGMVTKGIVKKNTASRYKSRLNARVKAI